MRHRLLTDGWLLSFIYFPMYVFFCNIYFMRLSLPSGDSSLALCSHICACLWALFAWAASLCGQTLSSLEIQQPSPLQRCRSLGRWASSQDMSEEGEEEKRKTWEECHCFTSIEFLVALQDTINVLCVSYRRLLFEILRATHILRLYPEECSVEIAYVFGSISCLQSIWDKQAQ